MLAVLYRAHGWIRGLNDAQEIADQYPDMDPRFLFATMGFNLRMSDIAKVIGMHQVDRIEDSVVRRRRNSNMVSGSKNPICLYTFLKNVLYSTFWICLFQ